MKYSVAAVMVAAAGVSAHYGSNVTVTTITTDKIVTYCPGPTEIVHGDKTYTVTEEGTITITDCPCTITKPVTTSTEVACETCAPETKTEVVEHPEEPTTAPVNPPVVETPVEQPPHSTGGVSPPPPAETPDVPTAGAATLSGAGLAGLLGLAAFVL